MEAKPQPESAELKQVVELEKKAQEYLDGWKRAKADYLNYKKEVEESQRELAGYAQAMVVMRFLPICDHFYAAFKNVPVEVKSSSWLKGVEQIHKQFNEILAELGLERIKTVGEKFNPEWHEAVAQEVKDGFATEIIFEEVKPGYTLGGKTLVPAKVKVTK